MSCAQDYTIIGTTLVASQNYETTYLTIEGPGELCLGWWPTSILIHYGISGLLPSVGTVSLFVGGTLIDSAPVGGGGTGAGIGSLTSTGFDDGEHFDIGIGGQIILTGGFWNTDIEITSSQGGTPNLNPVVIDLQVKEASDFSGGGTPPNAPTGLTVTQVDDHIHLAWSSGGGATEMGYVIYKGIGGIGVNPWVYYTPQGITEFDDYGVIDGNQYCYLISSFNADGETSSIVESCWVFSSGDIEITGSGTTEFGGEADVDMNIQMTGSGGFEVGQDPLHPTLIVLSANPSGIYTLVTDRHFDRIYTRNTDPDQTTDVAIPTPFAKTGYLGF